MFLQPSILDQMHDAVIITDLQGIVQSCNRAVANIYGFTPEELTGKSVAVLYPEEDQDRLQNEVLPAALGVGEFHCELRNRTRTGDYIYIHLSLTLLRDPGGNPVGFVGFSVNVTAQKLGQFVLEHSSRVEREHEALQQSSAHMRLLFSAVENAEDVVLITETDCVDEPGPRILYANRAFERMTGYSTGEVIGRTPRILQGPKTDRATLDRIREALQSWKPIREQLTNYRKDGSEFRVDLSIFPLPDERGRYTHWIAIQRDVTEQHLLQERLYWSEEQYRVFAESIPQLVWASTADGTKTFCNRRYLDYTGAESFAELGSNWISYIHPDDQARVLADWNRALASGEAYDCEYRLRGKDGVYRYFLARATPERDSDGKIRRWLGSSTDVDQKKCTEAALRQTEKLAVAGRLAASIAHEINNPLTSVLNSIYLAKADTELSEQTRFYLQQADDELARVAHVTTQTLGFFKQSTAPVLTDVAGVMDSVLALFAGRLKAANITIDKKYRVRSHVKCYRDEIRQVFANLISNAMDAIRMDGRISVHIASASLWNEVHPSGLRITVADTGARIDEELRSRVFDPFVSTKQATGTGLGLWVAKDIIEKHKGQITLRSCTSPSRHGTVFSIFLPYGVPPAGPTFSAPRSAS